MSFWTGLGALATGVACIALAPVLTVVAVVKSNIKRY